MGVIPCERLMPPLAYGLAAALTALVVVLLLVRWLVRP